MDTPSGLATIVVIAIAIVWFVWPRRGLATREQAQAKRVRETVNQYYNDALRKR